MTIEQRMSALYASPELASLDISNLPARFTLKARKPDRPEDVNVDAVITLSLGESERCAKMMKEMGVKPEIEVFNIGDFWYLSNLIEKHLVEPPYWIQCVMGFQGGMYPIPPNLLALLQYIPPNSVVSVLGVGTAQIPMITMGIILGCHVRVGLEDNLYIERGKLAESNAQQVEKVVRLAKEIGREIATPKQARQMIGISEKPRQYK